MASLFNSLKQSFKKVTDVLSRHSGANDVILVASEDGKEIQSSSWIVHTSEIRGKEAQARLYINGQDTEIVMHVIKEEMRCCFSRIGNSVCPMHKDLQRILSMINHGRNHAQILILELNQTNERFLEKEWINFNVFLWRFSDAVVCLDFEGVVLTTDVWSRGEHHRRTDSQESCTAREGVGAMLSHFHRAGYQCMILTSAPITRAERVRQILEDISKNEVSKWGKVSALPHIPVVASSDHTAKVLVDKLVSVSGINNRSQFKTSVISEVAALFQPALPCRALPEADGGGFFGGVCSSLADAQAYTDGGIPCEHLFFLDKAGHVCTYERKVDHPNRAGLAAEATTHSVQREADVAAGAAAAAAASQTWDEYAQIPLKEHFPQRAARSEGTESF